MKNIKTIEVTSQLPGLEVGDTLTRKDSESNFELIVETVTDNYTAKRYISLSPSLINKDEFKATEWFETIKTNKQKIAELEKDKTLLLDELNKANLERCEYRDIVLKYEARISEKMKEFDEKYTELSNKVSNEVMSAEEQEWADEALTVWYNMSDLLKKVIA